MDTPVDHPLRRGSENVGTLLCAARMRLDLDLLEVSKALKIQYNYLVAIEDGRFEDLPARVYATGFVRAYADYLGLDGGEVVRRFREESEGLSRRKPRFDFPVSNSDGGLPSGSLMALSVALGLVVYGGWYFYSSSQTGVAEVIVEVPEPLAALPEVTVSPEDAVIAQAEQISRIRDVAAPPPKLSEPADLDAAGAETPSEVDVLPVGSSDPKPEVVTQTPELETVVSAPPVSQPEPELTPIPEPAESVQEPEPEVAVQAKPLPDPETAPVLDSETGGQELPTPSEPAAEPEVIPVAEEPAQEAVMKTVVEAVPSAIELRAAEDSWIQVRRGEDVILTKRLAQGEVYAVPPGVDDLVLNTGNAGGLKVFVRGTALPSLGETGAVRRDIPLSEAGLAALFPPTELEETQVPETPEEEEDPS